MSIEQDILDFVRDNPSKATNLALFLAKSVSSLAVDPRLTLIMETPLAGRPADWAFEDAITAARYLYVAGGGDPAFSAARAIACVAWSETGLNVGNAVVSCARWVARAVHYSRANPRTPYDMANVSWYAKELSEMLTTFRAGSQ